MSNPQLSRRGFLGAAGAATASLAAGSARVDAASTGNVLTVRTQEHYGDVDERLAMPGSWDAKVYHMAGHRSPVLTPAQIRDRLRQPIGTKMLRDLARGKRDAVITFDDLTRPTPTSAILPHVIEELKEGGIPEERILLLTSYGSHSPMRQSEVARKTGTDIASRMAWVNHNIFEQVKEVGRTSLGNVIKINHHFARADLRICISGIKPHGTAGYGGGAKAILPGIAWSESINYMHRTIAGVGRGRNSTVGALKIYTNECRKDMDEAARMARVDFAVQTVYNGRREPVAVFAGDVVDGFRAACKMANGHLRTEVARNADIAIINTYPQSAQPFNGMSWARSSLRDGGSAVVISQFDQGPESIHYMRERWQYETASFWEVHAGRAQPVEHTNPLIVYSKTLVGRDRHRFPPGTHFAREWADVVERLGKRHRGDTRVAVYPYAPIQHPPLPLDSPA